MWIIEDCFFMHISINDIFNYLGINVYQTICNHKRIRIAILGFIVSESIER